MRNLNPAIGKFTGDALLPRTTTYKHTSSPWQQSRFGGIANPRGR